jgi:2-methylisocitrate lyase-like PEP mutase family enzyme
VPGATDLAELRALARAARVPLNVLAGAAPPAELHAHGVSRISTGSALYRAALSAASSAAESARTGDALPPSLSYAEVQDLLRRRAQSPEQLPDPV